MEIINLDKICGGCAAANLGTKLDTLEKDLAEEKTYSGELLSEEEVKTLNNICPVLSQLSLGTYINNVLTASKEGTEVENLTEEQIDMLNNQTCGGFQSAQVGTKIFEFVEEINKGAGKSDEANILTFVVNDIEGAIDQENGTIIVDVPSGTVLTAIAPTFTLSTGAVAKVGNVVQESGVTTNDFTNSVIYVITAEDGKTTKSYTVSIIPDNTIPWTEDTISHIMVFDKNVTTTIDPDTIEDTTGDATFLCGVIPSGLITYNFKTGRDDYMVNFSVFSDGSDHPEIINATYTSDDGFHWTLIEGEYVAGYEEDPPFDPIIVPFTANRTEVDTHNKYSIVANNSYSDAYPLLLEFVRTTPGGLE